MHIKIGYVSETANLEHVERDLQTATLVGIDTETTGLDPYVSKIRLLQVATVDATWVLDMFRLPKQAVLERIIKPLFERKDCVKIFQNAKFDLKMLQTNLGYGVREIQSLQDTYIMHKLAIGGTFEQSGLDSMAARYLGIELDKSFQKADWSKQIYKEHIVYAALDAAVLLPLFRLLTKSIVDNKLQRAAKLELDCVPAIAQLELNGIKIDEDLWLEKALAHKDSVYQIEQQLKDILGDINFNSPAQVAKALSDLSGLDIKSVAKSNLAKLVEDYYEKPDLFGRIVDYRPALQLLLARSSEAKALKSYGPGFLDNVHKKTGRVHSNFNQIDTKTHRFSSNSPNLQNIPAEFREAFIPPEGKLFACYDYSQIELRILAQLSGDDAFTESFHRGEDLHAAMAAATHGISIDKVTPDQRRFAKAINFGVPYGLGAPGLSRRLDITQDEASALLKAYYRAHPQLDEWIYNQKLYYKEYHCVRSVSGRLRNLSDWRRTGDHQHIADQASRNFPIQASNADIMKRAIARMFRELPNDWLLVNQVHDEVVLEVPEDTLEDAEARIKAIMIESAEEFIDRVPVKVDGGLSKVWTH